MVDFLENNSVLDYLNQDFLNIQGASVSVLANKKSFNEGVSCKSVLEGTFVRVDGVQFTASMSATGFASDCVAATKSSQENIQATFNNFLETYTPKITNYTYTISTSCTDDCDGKAGSLEIKLPGTYEIVPIGIGSFFNAFYKAYPTKDITTKSFMQVGSKFNYNGPATTTTDPAANVNLSIYNTSVQGLFAIEDATKQVTVELNSESINNEPWDSYSVVSFSSGFNVNSPQPQTGTFSLPKELLFDLYDGTTVQTLKTDQLEVTLQPTSAPVGGKGTTIVTIRATLFKP